MFNGVKNILLKVVKLKVFSYLYRVKERYEGIGRT